MPTHSLVNNSFSTVPTKIKKKRTVKGKVWLCASNTGEGERMAFRRIPVQVSFAREKRELVQRRHLETS